MEPMESWPPLDDLCHDRYLTIQSEDDLSLQSSAADSPQQGEPSQPEDCWPSLDATDPPGDTVEPWSSHCPSPTSSESLGSWPVIPESVDLNLHFSCSSSEVQLILPCWSHLITCTLASRSVSHTLLTID